MSSFPRRIDVEHVATVGDIDHALAKYYRDGVEAAAAASGVAERTIRDWVDEKLLNDQGFRSQTQTAPGPDGGAALLGELENRHLIRGDARGGTQWWELSHDRLVDPVRTDNDRWRAEHLSPLQAGSRAWVQAGRAPAVLLGAAALDEARKWAAANPSEVSATDRDYLAASQEAIDTAQREERARRRVLIAAVSAVALALLATLGVAFAITKQSDNNRLADLNSSLEASEAVAREEATRADEEAEIARAERDRADEEAAAAQQARADTEAALEETSMALEREAAARAELDVALAETEQARADAEAARAEAERQRAIAEEEREKAEAAEAQEQALRVSAELIGDLSAQECLAEAILHYTDELTARRDAIAEILRSADSTDEALRAVEELPAELDEPPPC